MFKSARIKLTAWYLLVIMTITLAFSSFIYFGVSMNAKKALENQRKRLERRVLHKQGPPEFLQMGPMIDTQTLEDIKSETLSNLIIINVFIFSGSGALGYLLAGKTLEPIENMVTKQKRFVSDAAHEIKTPLTAMKTSIEVTLRQKKLTLKELKETLNSTLEEINQLHNLTQKLLRKSKYQSNTTNKFKEINVATVIKNCIKKLKPLADEQQITIQENLDEVNVMGNKEELEELFTNLIDNAIKFSNKNSAVKVKIERNHDVEIKITDTGIGISKSDIKNIFEPFFRAAKSRSNTNVAGYGLGLAISKEIVERHKGQIKVESKINKGTTFTVKIPTI